MEMGLSFGEIVMIALVIIVLFGPNKIPQIARDLGAGVRKMKGAVEDIKTEILKESDLPISDIKKEIEKVKNETLKFDPSHRIKEELDKIGKTAEQNKKDQLDDSHEGSVSR